MNTQETQGKLVIRIQVPRGDDPPYAIDENKIYVRDEAETTLAVRDEIVRLVAKNPRLAHPEVMGEAAASDRRFEEPFHAIETHPEFAESTIEQVEASEVTPTPPPAKKPRRQRGAKGAREFREKPVMSGAPRTGVEILGTEIRRASISTLCATCGTAISSRM